MILRINRDIAVVAQMNRHRHFIINNPNRESSDQTPPPPPQQQRQQQHTLAMALKKSPKRHAQSCRTSSIIINAHSHRTDSTKATLGLLPVVLHHQHRYRERRRTRRPWRLGHGHRAAKERWHGCSPAVLGCWATPGCTGPRTAGLHRKRLRPRRRWGCSSLFDADTVKGSCG